MDQFLTDNNRGKTTMLAVHFLINFLGPTFTYQNFGWAFQYNVFNYMQNLDSFEIESLYLFLTFQITQTNIELIKFIAMKQILKRNIYLQYLQPVSLVTINL